MFHRNAPSPACLEVGDGTLRATQPSALNDPFECATTKTFVETDSDSGNRRFSAILTNIHASTPVSEAEVLKARQQYGSLYMRELMSRQLSRRFGVIAFASSPYHPLMWSHYTVDGSGFVIAYDVEELKNLCATDDYLRPVQYSKKPAFILGYGVLSDAGNILIFLAHKSDYWAYEKEWRLIVELNATIGTGTGMPTISPSTSSASPTGLCPRCSSPRGRPGKRWMRSANAWKTQTTVTALGISPSWFSRKRSTPTWKPTRPNKPDCFTAHATTTHD